MDVSNTAVGTEKEPLEMARQGILQMREGKGGKSFQVGAGFLNEPCLLNAIKSLSKQVGSKQGHV